MSGNNNNGAWLWSALPTGRRGSGHVMEYRELCLNMRRNPFTVRVVKQVVQRGCGVPMLADAQNPTGHSPQLQHISCLWESKDTNGKEYMINAKR